MFSLNRTIGSHDVYKFDTCKHAFLEFFEELYDVPIHELISKANDFKEYTDGKRQTLTDVESDLHKMFYAQIKSSDRFKSLYCALINDIYKQFYPSEPYLVYQSFPSIRLQYMDHVTVPPHCDSDDIGRHPLGEINYLIPITRMRGTNRLYIETSPQKGDFQGIDLDYGELLRFDGNKCIHYNEVNKESWIRVSLDFRVILPKDYARYVMQDDITITNPRDPEKTRAPLNMIVGGYYQVAFRGAGVEDMMSWYHMRNPIVQSRPHFDIREAEACYQYMTRGEPFMTEFRKTAELENMFKELTGSKHCFMTTSGTTALQMAFLACGVQPGDEVIVPNYTMVATGNSAKAIGAKVVLVDVHESSFTVPLDHIKKAVTERTKVVVHVSLNNRNHDLEDIVQFCKERNLFLVEDAAQSVGCTVNGRHYGTMGDIGCFSLSTPKIISTGQGGVLITNDDTLAHTLSQLKNFGRKVGAIEVYDSFGLNNKFTDVQAVIGIEQMKKLPARRCRLRQIFNKYYEKLSDFMLPPPNDEWLPWFVEMLTPHRESLSVYLSQHRVTTRPCYPSLHTIPVYHDCHGDFPNALRMSTEGLFLPTHPVLTDTEISYICDLILMFHTTHQQAC